MGAQVTRVDVRPEIFRWMRERAGMDLAGLTGRFPKYAEWEIGAVQPTFRQLEQLARTVHAPVGYFFFPEPVEEPVPIPDFRTIGSQPLARPSPNLLDTVYLCQQRQDWYREFVRREKEPPLSFVGSAKLGSDIEKVAAAIRKNLGFDLEERRALRTWTDALRQFVRTADTLGILVMVSGIVGSNTHRKLDPDEFRGFALVDDHAPLIFINGADSKAAQMFTLAHELAHLWLGQTALSNTSPYALPGHAVEAWCNGVAAELLVPLDVLREEYRETERLSQALPRLARRFKVSTLVVLRRIRDLGGLTNDEFRHAYDAELHELQAMSGSGTGGDFYLTQTVRVSNRFARAVVTSTLEGGTSFPESFRLLGCRKTGTFDKLAHRLGIVHDLPA